MTSPQRYRVILHDLKPNHQKVQWEPHPDGDIVFWRDIVPTPISLNDKQTSIVLNVKEAKHLLNAVTLRLHDREIKLNTDHYIGPIEKRGIHEEVDYLTTLKIQLQTLAKLLEVETKKL